MDNNDNKNLIGNDLLMEVETHVDKLKIADEVLETIAGIEASEVECVASMSGGFTDGIAGILGKKNLGKGVRVETIDGNVKVFLSITVEYGCRIHKVAQNVQNSVRTSLQDMTGLQVLEVNVNVVGINIKKEVKETNEVKNDNDNDNENDDEIKE